MSTNTYRSSALLRRATHQKGLVSFKCRKWLNVIWPGFIAGSVYFATTAPSVTGEDSGELITAAYFFGVPHPPGYPLWTLLCGTWIHLVPFGSVAWRANCFSGICSAVAVSLCAATLRHIGFRPMIAGAAAIGAGLSSAVWSQSVITEVYALNLLFTSALCLCVWRWHRERTTSWLLWGSLLFGLGMANHHILGFVGLGLVIWAAWNSPALLKQPYLAIQCVLCMLLGLTPYLYLLWAGNRDVPVNWGETRTLHAVWEHVSRSQYKTDEPIEYVAPDSAALLIGRLYYLVRWICRNFTVMATIVMLAGITWMYRRRSMHPLLKLMIILGLTCGPLFLWIGGPKLDRQDQFVQKVFLTPLALICAIPLAAGLEWSVAALRTLRIPAQARQNLKMIPCVLVLLVIAITNWPENNMRDYWFAFDHGQNMLRCMRLNAMIFPSGDHNTFPLLYLIHVEGIRRDVTVADKYGYIDLRLYRDMPNNPGKPHSPQERDEIERWIIEHSGRPIYYTVKKPSLIEGQHLEPCGLVYLQTGESPTDSESVWKQIHYRNLEGIAAPLDYAGANILADYHYAIGMSAMKAGRKSEGIDEFSRCAAYAWGIKEVFNNVGSALAEYGEVDAGIGYYEKAARMDWMYAPARWNLAKIFKASGRIDWSVKVFEDIVKAAPKDFRPYGELGFLQRDFLGNPDRARQLWYESLRHNPRQSQLIDALYQLDHPSDVQCAQPSLISTTQPNEPVVTDTEPPSSLRFEPALMHVRSTAVPAVQVEPSMLEWEILPGESPGPQSIMVTDQRGENFRIADICSSSPWFRAQWTLGAHPTHRIEVSCVAVPLGNVAGELELEILRTETVSLKVPLTVNIRPVLRANPPLINLGQLARAEKIERQVRIDILQRNYSSCVLEPITEPGLSADIRADPAAIDQASLAVSLDAEKMPEGAFMYHVRLRVEGVNSILEIPIHGLVSDQ